MVYSYTGASYTSSLNIKVQHAVKEHRFIVVAKTNSVWLNPCVGILRFEVHTDTRKRNHVFITGMVNIYYMSICKLSRMYMHVTIKQSTCMTYIIDKTGVELYIPLYHSVSFALIIQPFIHFVLIGMPYYNYLNDFGRISVQIHITSERNKRYIVSLFDAPISKPLGRHKYNTFIHGSRRRTANILERIRSKLIYSWMNKEGASVVHLSVDLYTRKYSSLFFQLAIEFKSVRNTNIFLELIANNYQYRR